MVRVVKSFLLVFTLHFSVAAAETYTNLPGISVPSESDIREAAVAFVNTTTSPAKNELHWQTAFAELPDIVKTVLRWETDFLSKH